MAVNKAYNQTLLHTKSVLQQKQLKLQKFAKCFVMFGDICCVANAVIRLHKRSAKVNFSKCGIMQSPFLYVKSGYVSQVRHQNKI